MRNEEIAKEARRLAALLGGGSTTTGPDAFRAADARMCELEQALDISPKPSLAIQTRLLYIASKAESLHRIGFIHPLGTNSR